MAFDSNWPRGLGLAAALWSLAGVASSQPRTDKAQTDQTPAPTHAQPVDAPPPSGVDTWVVVRTGRLIDPSTGSVSTGQALVIHNDRIVSIGSPASAPAGARLIDLGDETVLPGLVDVHVHLTAKPTDAGYNALRVSIPREAIDGVANAKKTLEAGFTTVRNVGASHFTDVALRDSINDGEVEGPRMQVSGPPLGATGGHADDNLLPEQYDQQADGVANGPWQLRAIVRRNIKYGADLIKFMATGGVLSHGDSVGGQQLSQEEMNAIVEEAHLWGRKVAVHAHGTDGIKAAIRAGADSIEHCSFIDAEGIALAKSHGTYLDMDIYNDDYIMSEGPKAGIEPASLAKEHEVGVTQRENFRKVHAAGAKMAFATDAGVYPHGDNARQFFYMVKYGMTPMQAIQAATVSGADLMGWGGKVGCIQAGCYADIIAVAGDPLQNVRALEQVNFVMKGGVVYRGRSGQTQAQ